MTPSTRAAFGHSISSWPLALERAAALAYSGVSDICLDGWVKTGLLIFLSHGPDGTGICLRAHLDELVEQLFRDPGDSAVHLSEDFDFAD